MGERAALSEGTELLEPVEGCGDGEDQVGGAEMDVEARREAGDHAAEDPSEKHPVTTRGLSADAACVRSRDWHGCAAWGIRWKWGSAALKLAFHSAGFPSHPHPGRPGCSEVHRSTI